MGLEVMMMGVWGGVALGWVFAVGGGVRVRVYRDGQGVMQGGWNESGWVGIGESLTDIQETTPPQYKNAYPEIDRRLLQSFAQSASV